MLKNLICSTLVLLNSATSKCRTPVVVWVLGCLIAFFPFPSSDASELAEYVSNVPVIQTIAFESGGQPIRLVGIDARHQVQVSAVDDQQQQTDLTRAASYRVEPPELAEIDATGLLSPRVSGTGKIVATFEGKIRSEIALEISGIESAPPINFPNQIVPIFTKLGCNSGGCHGKLAGQNGFRLSLLGFEPREDFEHLVNESRGRRLFPAVPDQSLLLLKAVNREPHGGGLRLEQDSHEYRVLRRWIAQGMPYGNTGDQVVTSIDVNPTHRTLMRGSAQQLSVVANYSDGSTEDITRTVQYESNATNLAEVSPTGLVTLTQQAGDAAVMARYQGNVAVFRVSVPLGIEIEQWPESRNVIDERVFAKLKTLGIPPSELCDDATFVRRATLDIAGRMPTIDETREFVSQTGDSKFANLVDRLLDSPEYADYFAGKWNTILRNQRSGAGEQFGAFAFHEWLRSSFYENKPYDQWVRELLTASGSVEVNPAVAWYREVSSTESRVEDTAQLFLGQRVQCARCHHHPFEKWSQADYAHLSAFFSKVTRKDSAIPEEPTFVSRLGIATTSHPKSGEALQPAGLGAGLADVDPERDARQALADWMTAPENDFFARSLANRYWKHFFSRGLVEPEDDMRVTNPPSNPELLDSLAEALVTNQYDLKAFIRLICLSNVYRFSSEPNENNLNDLTSYSRFYPKRLPAEVLMDAIDTLCGTQTNFDGMPAGTRAISLPDTSFSSYFLTVFGRPDASTACECERIQEANLAQSLHLLNSTEVQSKLSFETGRPAKFAAREVGNHVESVHELYLLAFSRLPNDDELQTAIDYLANKANSREAFEDLTWALINSKEFLFNH